MRSTTGASRPTTADSTLAEPPVVTARDATEAAADQASVEHGRGMDSRVGSLPGCVAALLGIVVLGGGVACALMRYDAAIVIALVFAGLLLVYSGLGLDMPTITGPGGWMVTFETPPRRSQPYRRSLGERPGLRRYGH